MRQWVLSVALVLFAVSPLAGEELPPISLGSGQSSTQNASGQTIELSVIGSVQVTIYFDNVNASQVSGLAQRTSGGTSSGVVTVWWVNTNRVVQLHLSAFDEEEIFSLEGGDGDKRAPTHELN